MARWAIQQLDRNITVRTYFRFAEEIKTDSDYYWQIILGEGENAFTITQRFPEENAESIIAAMIVYIEEVKGDITSLSWSEWKAMAVQDYLAAQSDNRVESDVSAQADNEQGP